LKKTRILIADDHGIVRKGLRLQLEQNSDFEVVGEATEGREAVRMAEEMLPDVVIMDIAMPNLNGIQATTQLVRKNPQIAVIILSMYSDETYLMRTLAAGAKGYLLKESADVDLLRAVEVVAQGKPFFSPAIADTLLEGYMRQLQQRGLQDSYDLLTDREKEVLEMLVAGRSNKEIGAALGIEERTVKAHVAKLMRKVGVQNRIALSVHAITHSLVSAK